MSEIVTNELANQRVNEVYAQQQQSSELTRWQLTTSDIVEQIEHDLAGEVWAETMQDGKAVKGWFRKTGAKAQMNEEGIREVSSIISAHVNKVSALTNLSKHDIKVICKGLHIDLAELFFFKQSDYELSTDNLNIVITKITNLVYMGLQKSLDEGERAFLSRTQRSVERIVERPQQAKKFGIF